MSATLVFDPVRPTKYTTLPYELRDKFTNKFNLRDGVEKLNSTHVPYLEGIRDASDGEVGERVQKLIDAIEKFGEVNLWLQY